jgi:hypothetical protein
LKVLDLTTTAPIKISTTESTSTTTTTTIRTTTTTTETTTTTTEVQKIYSENLIADAGPDIHVFYPSTVCVLNGNLTIFKPKNAEESITKWIWTKLDNSPAFGVSLVFLLLHLNYLVSL